MFTEPAEVVTETVTTLPPVADLVVDGIAAILARASRSAIALIVLPPNVAPASLSTVRVVALTVVAENVAVSATVRFLNVPVSALTFVPGTMLLPVMLPFHVSRPETRDLRSSLSETRDAHPLI